MPQLAKSSESKARRATAKIFLFDRRIRYCALVDHKGDVIAGGMRPGTTQLVPPQETARLHIQGMLHRGMHEGGTNFLGG